jgi:hypothetical protein
MVEEEARSNIGFSQYSPDGRLGVRNSWRRRVMVCFRGGGDCVVWSWSKKVVEARNVDAPVSPRQDQDPRYYQGSHFREHDIVRDAEGRKSSFALS